MIANSPAIVEVPAGAFDTALCNAACQQGWRPGRDLLLLEKGLTLAEKTIAEMQSVLHLDERHGAVSPRTAGGGFFSIPPHTVFLQRRTSREIWRQISPILTSYQVVPAAAPACVLIKSQIFEWFGPFDPALSSFAAALEDFICRINRRGFSALVANRAFIEPARMTTEPSEAERDLLLFRYPEYEQKLSRFEEFERDPVETFAILKAPHRPRLLYDLFHLTDSYSGTSEFGLSLLGALTRQLDHSWELRVGANLSNRFFAHELAGYSIYDDQISPPEVFDLGFKPCQFLSWDDLRRLDRLAPRVSFTLQDIIGVRCDYLNSPEREFVVQKATDLADCVFGVSEVAAADFSARFGKQVNFRTIHHGTHYGITREEFLAGEHVLVAGNNLAHKGVNEAVRFLNIDFPVVVLGGEPQPASPNVTWLASGALSRQHLRDLFSRARLVVYPSYYEGFGLPVVDALALGKPVIVLETAINRELDAILHEKNLHRIPSLAKLPEKVAQLLKEDPSPVGYVRRWSDAAAEYAAAFREMLAREWNVEKMRARRAFLRALATAD